MGVPGTTRDRTGGWPSPSTGGSKLSPSLNHQQPAPHHGGGIASSVPIRTGLSHQGLASVGRRLPNGLCVDVLDCLTGRVEPPAHNLGRRPLPRVHRQLSIRVVPSRALTPTERSRTLKPARQHVRPTGLPARPGVRRRAAHDQPAGAIATTALAVGSASAGQRQPEADMAQRIHGVLGVCRCGGDGCDEHHPPVPFQGPAQQTRQRRVARRHAAHPPASSLARRQARLKDRQRGVHLLSFLTPILLMRGLIARPFGPGQIDQAQTAGRCRVGLRRTLGRRQARLKAVDGVGA
eukprot:scaffold36298_cov122-Isochrysis_galbana.AAC.17